MNVQKMDIKPFRSKQKKIELRFGQPLLTPNVIQKQLQRKAYLRKFLDSNRQPAPNGGERRK